MEIDLNNPDLPKQMTLNFDRIAGATEYSSVIRLLASDIKKSPYFVPSVFFKTVSDSDLRYLVESFERIQDNAENPTREGDKAIQEMILLSEMLATGEGCATESEKQSMENLNFLGNVVMCVSLARKGLVKVFYDNISFGEDMKDAPIAARL